MTQTTLIVVLIFAFIALFIGANAITQYKHKLAVERRHKLMKLSAAVGEVEEVLTNTVMLPMSGQLTVILLGRIIGLYNEIIDLMPDATSIQERQLHTQEQLDGIEEKNRDKQPSLNIPQNDPHIAALIKTIKKVRFILQLERRNGHISQGEFLAEDKVQAASMVKIFTEYKINQATIAIKADQLGSARQFLEKALKTLNEQPPGDDYFDNRIEDILVMLKDISKDLANLRAEGGEVEEPTEDMGDLKGFFSDVKKKW